MIQLLNAEIAEQKNAPELPIGRFLKSKSLGGNRVILIVTCGRVDEISTSHIANRYRTDGACMRQTNMDPSTVR